MKTLKNLNNLIKALFFLVYTIISHSFVLYLTLLWFLPIVFPNNIGTFSFYQCIAIKMIYIGLIVKGKDKEEVKKEIDIPYSIAYNIVYPWIILLILFLVHLFLK